MTKNSGLLKISLVLLVVCFLKEILITFVINFHSSCNNYHHIFYYVSYPYIEYYYYSLLLVKL